LTFDLRYPATFRSFAEGLGFPLDEYDSLRGTYRATSGVFAAALSAYARQQSDAFEALKNAYVELEKDGGADFATAIEKHRQLGGLSPAAYLESIEGVGEYKLEPEECAKGLCRLESDVGMDLATLVAGLSDAVAFLELSNDTDAARSTPASLTAYPTAAVVVQDNQTLTTTVTVTTLVQANDLETITTALDPQSWQDFSDAFHEVYYVGNDSTFEKAATLPRRAGIWDQAKHVLLREHVRVPSGLSPTVIAEFDNVLSLDFDWRNDVADPHCGANLKYRLYRSIESRYLWDAQAGGILIDEGYIKVRLIARDAWRLTVRKILRFADRTPLSWGDTPLQFGQSLNYLAPAALSWWLQSDVYSAAEQRGRTRVNG
jgi:hypothetical protein